MMADFKEPFHESVIIKRAKRRLIGAVSILIILFVLSIFFVKNRDLIEADHKEIKVSFLEMGEASFSSKNDLEQIENIDINKTFKMEGIQFKINTKDSISIKYEKNSFNFGEIVNYLSKNDIKILDIVTEDGDLEDVFVQLTNN